MCLLSLKMKNSKVPEVMKLSEHVLFQQALQAGLEFLDFYDFIESKVCEIVNLSKFQKHKRGLPVRDHLCLNKTISKNIAKFDNFY